MGVVLWSSNTSIPIAQQNYGKYREERGQWYGEGGYIHGIERQTIP